MRVICLLNFLFLFTQLFSQNENSNCLIKPSIGIDKITLNITSVDTIYNLLSKTELKKENYGKENGGIQYILSYPEKGITIRLFKAKKVYQIISIEAKAPCECKTTNGIGLGTTKEELIEKMGKPRESWENETESHLDYKGVLFLLKNNGQNKFLVSQLMIVP